MADLLSDAYIKIKGEKKSEIFFLDTSGAQTIYKGQPLIIDQNVDAVNVRGYVDATTVAATDVFVGIADEGVSVLSGAPETTEIKVITAPSIVGFKSAVFTNADLGATVYMSDSATLSATPDDNPQIGTLFKVEDGFAYVKLTSPQICAGA
jgi:hypothetical protein